jgi:hypothetical protein
MITVNTTGQLLLDSSTLVSKLEYLQLLKSYFEGGEYTIISNVERLINELHILISSFSKLALPAVDVLTALITISKDSNINHFIHLSYPILVSALKSSEAVLVKALCNCILCCFKKTSDFSTFFTAIQDCALDSGNSNLRRNSMAVLISIAKSYPQLFDDSRYTLQLLPIIENAIKYKSELGTSLIQLAQLQPSINKLSKMLSLELKIEYDELMQTNDNSMVGRLKYGVVPERIVRNLEPTANWKQRAGAIEELEEIISKEGNKSMLEPTAFLEFLIKLLSDPNYKVAVTTLQIIKRLLETYTVIHTSNNVQALIPGLIEKLGDNKVMIRELSTLSLRLISEIADPILLLTKLLPHLSGSKWHTRKEILAFIIISFLENGSDPDFLKRVPYIDLVSGMVPLLDDDKPKVRQMAFEAFATISKLGDFNLTWILLAQYINDNELLQELKARIDVGVIPVLTEDGQLEFPYITNEITSKNSFDLQIQYSNLGTDKKGRFTSAGTTNKIDRNLFGVNSAAKKIQADHTDDYSGRASPRFGNGNLEEVVPEIKLTAPNKSMESGPDWLTDWKDVEKKKEVKPIPRPYVKPISNESSRTDSTRAGSTEPNSRILNEKLKMLKAAKANIIEEDKNMNKVMQNTRQEKKFTQLNPQVQLPIVENTSGAAYLTTEQITPLENPEAEWYKCTETIKSSNNWLKQFDACNIARRICTHHSSTLSTSSLILHGFILDLLRLVESLRSSLARNVLLLFDDLFTYGKRALEPDLDQIIPVLLKKGTESGSFLGSQAIDALKKMCETCSESRVVAALLSSISGFAKITPQAKFRAITFLNLIARKLGSRIGVCKEGERIILALSSNLSEGPLEIRIAAKEGLIFISDVMGNSVEFEKLLQRSLNSMVLYKKVMNALAKTNQKNLLGEDLPNSDMKVPLAPKSTFTVTNSDVC